MTIHKADLTISICQNPNSQKFLGNTCSEVKFSQFAAHQHKPLGNLNSDVNDFLRILQNFRNSFFSEKFWTTTFSKVLFSKHFNEQKQSSGGVLQKRLS